MSMFRRNEQDRDYRTATALTTQPAQTVQEAPHKTLYETAIEHTDRMIQNARKMKATLELRITQDQEQLRETEQVLAAYEQAAKIIDGGNIDLSPEDLSPRELSPEEQQPKMPNTRLFK